MEEGCINMSPCVSSAPNSTVDWCFLSMCPGLTPSHNPPLPPGTNLRRPSSGSFTGTPFSLRVAAPWGSSCGSLVHALRCSHALPLEQQNPCCGLPDPAYLAAHAHPPCSSVGTAPSSRGPQATVSLPPSTPAHTSSSA